MYFHLFFALFAGGFGFLISVLFLLVMGFPLVIVLRRSFLVFVLLFTAGLILTIYIRKQGGVSKNRKQKEELKQKVSEVAAGSQNEQRDEADEFDKKEFSPMNPTVLEVEEEEEQ
ncbi:MAG: hypothetical protein ACOCZM_00540 [Bacillota bacterium]